MCAFYYISMLKLPEDHPLIRKINDYKDSGLSYKEIAKKLDINIQMLEALWGEEDLND